MKTNKKAPKMEEIKFDKRKIYVAADQEDVLRVFEGVPGVGVSPDLTTLPRFEYDFSSENVGGLFVEYRPVRVVQINDVTITNAVK